MRNKFSRNTSERWENEFLVKNCSSRVERGAECKGRGAGRRRRKRQKEGTESTGNIHRFINGDPRE